MSLPLPGGEAQLSCSLRVAIWRGTSGNCTLNRLFPFMTMQGEGQGEALLLSQVCKQNPMFAVPGCPWSGSSEAGWGMRRGVPAVDGVGQGASPLPPSPLGCYLICHRAQALPSACCGTGQCPLNCCAQCHPSLVRWPGVGAHFFPTLRDPSRLLDPIPEQRVWDYIFLALKLKCIMTRPLQNLKRRPKQKHTWQLTCEILIWESMHPYWKTALTLGI